MLDILPGRAAKPCAAALLRWYDRHRRTMPWRARPGERPDPYHVWLSEIMLQQTTVAAVRGHFERFLARFPDVSALAAAALEDVLEAWAGLGYYARARNLHACARLVAARGGFPTEEMELRALPGVGAYTAAAIASIAFGRPAVPVDGNVERVATRVFAIELALPRARAEIAAAARRLGEDAAAHSRPADFTQALFDLGATICTPRAPACALCPWARGCAGLAAGIAAELPRKAPRAARPMRYGAHFWLTDASAQVLLRRRPPSGLLGGMLELPGTDWRAEPWPEPSIRALAPEAAEWRHAGSVRHGFTHFELHLDVYAASVHAISAPGVVRLAAGLEATLPSVMRKCARVGKIFETSFTAG